MKKTWALKLVGRHTLNDKKLGPVINFPRTVKLLQAEHARAVRIVKADLAEVKRDQHNYSVVTKNELVKRLERLLVKLQKGRA